MNLTTPSRPGSASGPCVTPGWYRWFGHYGGSYYSLGVNDNGTDRHYGSTASDYCTDAYSNEAQNFIGASAQSGDPFFAFVTPIAPHYPLKMQHIFPIYCGGVPEADAAVAMIGAGYAPVRLERTNKRPEIRRRHRVDRREQAPGKGSH